MPRQFALLIGIGLLNLILFSVIFTLLQDPGIYSQTLGVISQNYERSEDWENFEIKKVSKPYLELDDKNILTWDAPIYGCIRERMYIPENECYGKVRAAFFPLFPLVWKVLNCSPFMISLFNYMVFIASLAILILFLLKGPFQQKLIIFSLLITIPSNIIYYIPYTESMFLLTMTIAVVGIIKKKYWIYFVGFLLLAMVRPATVFVLMALLIIEAIVLIRNKNIKAALIRIVKVTIPFLLGYFISLLIQYSYYGNWHAFIDAHSYWSGEVQKIVNITDWSVEGFGMNTFAIVFVSIPAFIFALYILLNIFRKENIFINSIQNNNLNYLFSISIFYLVGIFIFTLISSGGNLHSYFRFTLTTPLFYVAVIILLNYLFELNIKKIIYGFLFLSLLLFVFFRITDYGGDRLSFSFMGLYPLMLTFLYLGVSKSLTKSADVIVLSVLVLGNIVWSTYLFNIYLSNAWIFA